ncbi:hypothetical protein ACWIG5_29285 [Streptomyces lydicus]
MVADPHTLILAFDFPGRRAAAGFDRLFQELPHLRALSVTIPEVADPLAGASYADAAMSSVAPGDSVLAVAFCSAAPLAQEALCHLDATGVETTGLLLADPVLPGEFNVRDGLTSTLGQIGGVDAPDLIESMLRDDTRISAPAAWRAKVLHTVRAALSEALGCEIQDEVVTGLSSRYIAYLDFILATLSCTYPPYHGRSVALSSADHRMPQEWPGLPSLVHEQTSEARRDLVLSQAFKACLLDLIRSAARR